MEEKYEGFLEGKSAMESGRISKVLSKRIKYDVLPNAMDSADAIKTLLDNGFTTREAIYKGKTDYVLENDKLSKVYSIKKIEYDFAEFINNKSGKKLDKDLRVGDWVYCQSFYHIYKIIDIKNGRAKISKNNCTQYIAFNNLVKKEGLPEPMFGIGDIVITPDGRKVMIHGLYYDDHDINYGFDCIKYQFYDARFKDVPENIMKELSFDTYYNKPEVQLHKDCGEHNEAVSKMLSNLQTLLKVNFDMRKSQLGLLDVWNDAGNKRDIRNTFKFSEHQRELLDKYDYLNLFPDYTSDNLKNICNVLNKELGNYFFLFSGDNDTFDTGVAWIDGFSQSEVKKYVMDLFSDEDFQFLFTTKYFGDSRSWHNNEINIKDHVNICLRRIKSNFALTHFAPKEYHYVWEYRRNYAEEKEHTMIDINDVQLPFVEIPINNLVSSNDNIIWASELFWELEGNVKVTNINEGKKVYLNMLQYNFPYAAFKVSHEPGTKNIVVKYNGVDLLDIKSIDCFRFQYSHSCLISGDFCLRKYPNEYELFMAHNFTFVKDDTLPLPKENEVKRRRLAALTGKTKLLTIRNKNK